jgi:uncharacterized protein Yka (UPF0111/DUF47 family)
MRGGEISVPFLSEGEIKKNMFEEEKDAIRVIKMKEVLSTLETATDMCEDAANVIETIIVKYA